MTWLPGRALPRSPAQALVATAASTVLGYLAGRWRPVAPLVAAHAALGKVFLAGIVILAVAAWLLRLFSATPGS